MKKYFKYYGLGWLISLVLFNVITFVTPNEVAGISKFDSAFWIGYIFITFAFFGQFGCSFFFFKEERKEKVFLNIPIISISFTALIVSFIVGTLCMVIPSLPYWVGVIACVAVLAFYAITIIKAKTAAEAVEEIGQKVKHQTFFIKSLTVDADNLMARAKSNMVKVETEKVYEALCYSDPMSNDALVEIEVQITENFKKLSEAVEMDSTETVKAIAGKLLLLIRDRNKKCKLLK